MKIFKTILLCGAWAVLFASVAQAHPYRIEGTMVFTGVVEPRGRLTVDVIDHRLPDAKKRLEQALAQGAHCEPPTNGVIRCSRMWDATHVAPESLRKAAVRNEGFYVAFSDEAGEPVLISKGSGTTIWHVPQGGVWNGDRFTSYRYVYMHNTADDIVKLMLDGGKEAYELMRYSDRTYGKLDAVVVNESRWRWHIDYVSAILEPAN